MCYRTGQFYLSATFFTSFALSSCGLKHELSAKLVSKTRSQKIDLVNYQYSGNAHDVIAGIGLINTLWHGLDSKESIPIDYRIYDKDTDGKTKNTHFCDMLKLAKSRGITPSAVVMDAWYSSLNN